MANWTHPPLIGLCCDSPPEHQHIGRAIFEQLKIPCGTRDDQKENHAGTWIVNYRHPVLQLQRHDNVCLSVDFVQGKSQHRSREPQKGSAPLAKALGLNSFKKRHAREATVVDATAGWGQDGWAIASLGVAVTMIEENPLVFALLSNGIERALDSETACDVAQAIRLVHGNAVTTLSQVLGDIIYLDPMYPDRTRKRALSKKNMQFLHELLGPSDEQQSERLLASALQSSAVRVVVKRPKEANTLTPPNTWQGQQTSVSSPNTRYDIYLSHI